MTAFLASVQFSSKISWIVSLGEASAGGEKMMVEIVIR